eukprot:13381585-Heterocapsa_arctica.AAC.2
MILNAVGGGKPSAIRRRFLPSMRSSSRTLRPLRGAMEERDLPPARAAKASVLACLLYTSDAADE